MKKHLLVTLVFVLFLIPSHFSLAIPPPCRMASDSSAYLEAVLADASFETLKNFDIESYEAEDCSLGGLTVDKLSIVYVVPQNFSNLGIPYKVQIHLEISRDKKLVTIAALSADKTPDRIRATIESIEKHYRSNPVISEFINSFGIKSATIHSDNDVALRGRDAAWLTFAYDTGVVYNTYPEIKIKDTEAKKVLSIEVTGPITTGTLELFKSSLEEARDIDAEALLVIIDTPGGGLTETLEIVKLIDRTEIPVISYVHPKGATAWSAGTIILVSSHVAAMTPNTIIGSAQPAALSTQGFAPINESKIINALTALVAEKARLHKRNETAAVAFIKENLNLNPEQAKNMKVIEFISPNIEDLLNQIDGKYLSSIKKTLTTKNAEIVEYKPSLRIQFLNLITNPMLASIFLILGIYALVFGFASPGFGSEIAGIVLISLGLLGLGFDINIVAVFLLLFGIVLLLLEIKMPGFGALGIAGIIATIIGSILLVPAGFPRYFISKEFQKTMIATVVVPSIIFGIFLLFALYKVLQIRKKKPEIGELIGEIAIVTEKITPKKTGYVEYKGEIWQASSNKKIEKGEEVVIEGKKGPVLIVREKL